MATNSKNEIERHWYAACSVCTAKWFSRSIPASCPRCGQPALEPMVKSPPWLGQSNCDTEGGRTTMAKPPIHEIRLGLIKASIWQNQSKQGTTYAVTVARLYKNGQEWKESTRFHRDDLLIVGKVLNQAHSWIFANQGRNTNELKEKGESHAA